MRALAFGIAIAIGAAVSAAACSESTDAPSSPPADASVTPEASADSAPGPTDAAVAPDTVLPYDGSPAPVVCTVTPCVTRVVAGPSVYCAIIDDGTLRCWGDATLLAHADAGADASPAPAPIHGLVGVKDVAITASQVCAVSGDGGIDCWDGDHASPAPVAKVPAAKRLSLGPDTSCAITSADQVYCWGDSFVFGSDAGTIGTLTAATDVSVIDTAAFALDTAGTLESWGQSGLLLGRSTSFDIDHTPRPLLGLPPVRSFSASVSHACAATTDGRMFCWGSAGDDALLGTGYSRDERYPTQVAFEPGYWPFQVSTSDSHSCARETDGRVACWGGRNAWGELGFATQVAIYVPLKVSALPLDIVQVAVGLSSSCALSRTGAVYCWGDNREGQLGQGSRDNLRHPNPAQVVFP